jgi:hypothetical protein
MTKLFNYNDITYTLQKLELKDIKPGQIVICFMARGQELTYDIHYWKVVSVKGENVSYTQEGLEGGFSLYDYQLSPAEAERLEVDKLDKHSEENYSMDFLVIGSVYWK